VSSTPKISTKKANMERIDSDCHMEPHQNVSLADKHKIYGAGYGYCLTCRCTFTNEDFEDHSSCPTRLLSSMVASAQSEYAAWQQFQNDVSSLIQNECSHVDDAADSAIGIISSIIRAKAEEMKCTVIRSCSDNSLSRILQNQKDHVERLADICRFDGVEDFNFLQSLHQVSNKVPYPPPQNCGVFYPAIAEVKALAKFMFLGRVLGGVDDEKVRIFIRLNPQSNMPHLCNPSLKPLDASKVKMEYTKLLRGDAKNLSHYTSTRMIEASILHPRI
jgi:hypothetical protein